MGVLESNKQSDEWLLDELISQRNWLMDDLDDLNNKIANLKSKIG